VPGAGPRISGRALRRLRPPRVPLDQRKFTGCSSIDMYDVGQKLGQGTFG
jgi:serine/threonine-protein kinase BUR1